MDKLNIMDMVKDGRKVYFKYYRKGNLWYETQGGFLFPVPISDTGDANFLVEDKAILFMRYINKQIELIEEEKANGRKL